MNHGTVTVSASAMASVLIGSKRWLQMPKAVAIGECVCTAPVEPGRARYDAKCILNSIDGFLPPFDHAAVGADVDQVVRRAGRP